MKEWREEWGGKRWLGEIHGRKYEGMKKMRKKRGEGRTQVIEEQRDDGVDRRDGGKARKRRRESRGS